MPVRTPELTSSQHSGNNSHSIQGAASFEAAPLAVEKVFAIANFDRRAKAAAYAAAFATRKEERKNEKEERYRF